MNVFNFHSHKTQLIATALAASLATAALLSGYTSFNKRQRRKNLDQNILRSIVASGSNDDLKTTRKGQNATSNDIDPPEVDHGIGYDEELIREQLARNYAFFGEEGMRKLRGGTVVIVGCGGVGSWAAVMLVRSYVVVFFLNIFLTVEFQNLIRGVSKIRLVDFDYVTLSSLNRHATAGLSDVGTPKVKCIERTLRQISRWVDVDSRIEIWRKEDGGSLLESADWVVGKLAVSVGSFRSLKYSRRRD